MDTYVLDTSAWLTLIEDEAGADQVQELLEKARAGEAVVLVSFMSFTDQTDQIDQADKLDATTPWTRHAMDPTKSYPPHAP